MSELRIMDERGIRTVWAGLDQLDALETAIGAKPDQIAKARADLENAEARGFLYCEAVFVDAEYDGLHEKAHPTSGSLNWGRGQDVTKRNFFRNGKLEKDPAWKPDPPVAAWESFGLHCEVRENRIGYLCGYVSVPPSHPWYAFHYDDCIRLIDCPTRAAKGRGDEGYHSCYEHSPDGLVEVHGGLTYSGREDDGSWTFGFDCAHSGDAPSPEWEAKNLRTMGFTMGRDGDHYWTADEVRAETELLAEQLSKVTA